MKFSSFGWDGDVRRIRSGKSLSLGMPKAPQGNIYGRLKDLSLGMPSAQMASPLSSSKLSVYLTWNYIFILHMICVLLGASFVLLGFVCLFAQSLFPDHTYYERHTFILYLLNAHLFFTYIFLSSGNCSCSSLIFVWARWYVL